MRSHSLSKQIDKDAWTFLSPGAFNLFVSFTVLGRATRFSPATCQCLYEVTQKEYWEAFNYAAARLYAEQPEVLPVLPLDERPAFFEAIRKTGKYMFGRFGELTGKFRRIP